MIRYTSRQDRALPRIAIDIGYSAKTKSCGVATSWDTETESLQFGECIEHVAKLINAKGRHLLILEAVLSTYHLPNGNPSIRGDFEKGRGWYHGPGVTTFAAALRFLQQLDITLKSKLRPIPVVEGFLSYKPQRTEHADDAKRMLDEFEHAERFRPEPDSKPICDLLDNAPEILRYNAPKQKAAVTDIRF